MTQNAETYAVPGFLANGIHAGIKQDSMKDLALIFSTVPAKVSALFTKNRIKAAPVLLDMERVKTGLAQAPLDMGMRWKCQKLRHRGCISMMNLY